MIKRRESEIQKEIINFLQILENRGLIYFIRCNVFSGKIKRAGGLYFIVRSVSQAITIINNII